MSGAHPDIGPELRKLAQALLDGIDPALRSAAVLASPDNPGECQQVWCPVCAMVALATGQSHPLLTVIAEHGPNLLAVIRAAVAGTEGSPTPPPSDGPPAGGTADTATNSSYERIPVSVEE